jgi:PleD family two-component response regulator
MVIGLTLRSFMAEAQEGSRPIVVLIANDQEWSARSLESILTPNGYTVVRVFTGQQALQRARTARPDLVILDAQLPDLHGLEVCRQLRADPLFGPTTPVIITTAGPSGRSQRLAAYEAGAWGFFGQPLDGEELLARLGTFLSAKFEADGLRDAAMLETLDGLYTLKGLTRRVREIASEASRHGRPLAVVALALAPVSGSESAEPMQLGALLRSHGRSSDVIAHLGEGEFLVVAPGTIAEGVRGMVHRFEGLLRDAPAGGTAQLVAGYSAVPDLRVAAEPSVLLDQATTALRYAASHRNHVTVLAFQELPATPN